MAAHVSVGEVQQWLEKTKLDITASGFDAELEISASELVFSKLQAFYETETWADATTTPRLVRKIIAMLVAGWMYNRQYSEDADDSNWWGDRLEKTAMDLLNGLSTGATVLIDVTTVDTTVVGDPSFYPTDAQDTDGAGEHRRFTMGQVF